MYTRFLDLRLSPLENSSNCLETHSTWIPLDHKQGSLEADLYTFYRDLHGSISAQVAPKDE